MNFDQLLLGLTLTGFGGATTYFSVAAARAALPAMRDLTTRGAMKKPLVPGRVPNGQWLESRCLSIDKGTLRQTDGAFVAGFEITPTETFLGHDDRIAEEHRKMVTWLTNEAPVGTTYQFRQAINLDNGKKLIEHYNELSRVSRGTVFQDLHLNNLQFLEEKIRLGQFRRSLHTLWVRVPTASYTPGIKLALHELRLQLNTLVKKGHRMNPKAIMDCLQENELVRRLADEEMVARKKAEEIFQQVIRNCPYEIRRYDSKELWRTVYFSHNESAESSPRLPGTDFDLGQYLSDEKVVFGEDAVVHGGTPVAIVSLTTPPQATGDGKRSGTYPTVMRQLTANPTLGFRHTIITEFQVVNQNDRRKRYDRSIEWTKRAGANLFGGGASKEANQRIMELDALRGDMATGQTQIMSLKQQVLIYGERLNQAEVEDFAKARLLPEQHSAVLESRAKAVLNAFRDIPGANAIRENRAASLCLYPNLLAGEMSGAASGREIEEVVQSVATFVSHETSWSPARIPATFFRGMSGELIGLNLFESGTTRPPATAIFGETGSGKSVLAGALILDTQATHPETRVQVVDFNSFRTFAEVTGGLLFQFHPQNKAGFNIGYYDGLHEGKPVEEEQVTLVLGDLKILAGLDIRDTLSAGLLEPVVREVYVGMCAHNRTAAGTNSPVQEPTLSDFLDGLKHWCDSGAFTSETLRTKAADILLRLERFRGNEWLDKRMDKAYLRDSPLIVYDMESLNLFNEEIRRALAFRVAARTTQAMNVKLNDERPPRLNVFDEMARISRDYPEILYAIEKGAFQGRKSNVQTILIAQNYQQIYDLNDIVRHVGLKIIGRQNGDYKRMIADFNISDDCAGAIENITNQPGSHAQFVMTLGEGIAHRADFFQFELSSFYLWIFTTEPNEVTALRKVREILGDPVRAILFLSSRYPRGLAFEKKNRLTDDDLLELETIAKGQTRQ